MLLNKPADEMIKPRYFTTCEGGNWTTWLLGPISLNWLNNLYLRKRKIKNSDVFEHKSTVVIPLEGDRIKVHSLLFGDIRRDNFANIQEIPRWDCVNGWTNAPVDGVNYGKPL